MNQKQDVDVKEAALGYFAAGHNCAEAVLLAVAHALDAGDGEVARMATGFGAGIGYWGEVCGSLTGAVIALGLRFGRKDPLDVRSKERVYALADRLMREFEDKFGDIRCLSLTGCNMRTAEGLCKAKELDLHHSLCPQFVGFVAERTLKMIKEIREDE